jgi:methionine synthase / methylenetetrahydrofolate reductase(NADPH)
MTALVGNSDFREVLRERALVADGAMGTSLNAAGFGFEHSFEGLNLSNPSAIEAVHRSFVAAGADLLETNTFAATPTHLERWNLADRCEELNVAAVRIARAAAASSTDRQVFVAGSVGPTGQRLAPLGPLTVSDAAASFAVQITALAEAGVDVLVFETFADLVELELALATARSICALPIVASMSFTREVRTTDHVVPEVAFARLRAAGVDVIGANCSTGPRGVFEVVSRYDAARSMEAISSSGPVFAAMPNAGYPESRGERLYFPAPPDYFAEYARQFLAVGARIIGGCCGTTPEHISGVRHALDEAGTKPLRSIRPAAAPQTQVVSTAPELRFELRPTALQAALANGTFVTTVEMEPPRSHDTTQIESHARLLRDAGVTTLNISDTPMARMRMTGLAAAVRVGQATALEPVLHFPVRGRNLLRVQGDLLAAHALGVRTLFVTMGDLASIGDYPQAFDNHDIVPTGLIQLIKQKFNAGVDSAGASIGSACSFFVGTAANLTPSNFEGEAKLLRKKIAFGADFALTQPVFDATRAVEFLKYYENNFGALTLPLLVGVLPLATVRHAIFLKNEVPGMAVPDELVRRMESSGSDERAEGRRIAHEMLEEIRPFAQGAYFIPAFRRYDVIVDLVATTSA